MIGQRVGYVRVSSFDQNPERQLEDVEFDRVFSDKASGKDAKRPQLEALMTFVRAGDTVVVHSMDLLYNPNSLVTPILDLGEPARAQIDLYKSASGAFGCC